MPLYMIWALYSSLSDSNSSLDLYPSPSHSLCSHTLSLTFFMKLTLSLSVCALAPRYVSNSTIPLTGDRVWGLPTVPPLVELEIVSDSVTNESRPVTGVPSALITAIWQKMMTNKKFWRRQQTNKQTKTKIKTILHSCSPLIPMSI